MINQINEYLAIYIPNQYIRAALVFFVSLVFFRLLFSAIERLVIRITLKTKTDIDDLIAKKFSLPLTIFVFLLSIRLGFSQLTLSDLTEGFLLKGIYSIWVFSIAYILYAIIDIGLLRIWERVSRRSKIKIEEGLTSILHGFIKILLVVLSILYVLDFWGIKIGPFLAALGIAGLAVALALQPTLSNIFSGVSMILDKSIRIGDIVYLNAETKGRILKVGIRSTKIKTFDNELIIVPNSKLAESNIQNVALPEPKSRVVIPFSVAYGSDIEKVKKTVLNEIKRISNLERDPEPMVRFIEMGASSLNFKSYFYVDSFENRFKAIDEANTLIYNALRKNKIEIPFPQMDVHIKKK